MNVVREDSNLQSPTKTVPERVRAACEVVLAGLGGTFIAQSLWVAAGSNADQILSSADSLALFLAADATLTLLLVFLLLRLQGERPSRIGFGRRPFGREGLLGLLLLPVFVVGIGVVGLFFSAFLPHLVTTENRLLNLIQTPRDVLLFLASSIYVGGIKEEIQRAFVLTRFEEYLGGATTGLLISSVLFGLGHGIQGVDNAVKAGVLGLGFGILFLWRRDPTAAIVAHVAWDVATVVMVWFLIRN